MLGGLDEAPWRVSAPSSCKGALRPERGRRKGGCLASWVSPSSSSWETSEIVGAQHKVEYGLLAQPGCDRMGLWVSSRVVAVAQIGCDALRRE